MKRVTYQRAGVSINKAEEFVKSIKAGFSKDSINNISAFGSLFDFGPLLKKYKKPVLVSSTDGVGTKLKVAQQLGIHDTVGIDLVAMNVNDIVCLGAVPLFFLDYIACGKLKPEVLVKVVGGIRNGLNQCGCLLLGGETAEMPGMYKPDEYDLAGFSVGVADKDFIIDGSRIRCGDMAVGLESSGLHSNGFSLVRKVLTGKNIKKYSRYLIEPTRIYVKTVLSLLEAIGKKQSSIVKGIAHVTGGAFYKKVVKILPAGMGIAVDKKSWNVPQIFKVIQDKGCISDKEMYSVFNMGIGMVLIVDKQYVGKVMAGLSRKCKSYVIGEVIRSNKKMTLV